MEKETWLRVNGWILNLSTFFLNSPNQRKISFEGEQICRR
jgi:hypothetical protein